MELSRGKLAAVGGAIALVAWVAWLAKRDPVAPYLPTSAASGSGTTSAPSSLAPTATSPVVVSGSTSGPNKALPPPQEIPWGTGSGALGRTSPAEGNPEAPMSVAVGPDGTRWVLDQVNDRIVRYGKDGKVIDTLPLTVKGAQDIVATKDGGAAVLDRLADKRVALYGPDGKPRGALTLEGKGLAEGGAATGVFVDGEGVYVEREHEQLVKVGDTKGNADPDRKEIPGRPTRDGGGYVRAWLGEIPGQRAFVTFTDKQPEAHRFTRQIHTALVSSGIVLLDTDRAGVVYLGVIGGKASPNGELGEPTITLYCLEPAHGAPIGQTTAPANTGPEETFRDLAVQDEGGVIYLRRTEKGVSVVTLDCRGGG
jgi:streptogramin lyase